MKKIVFILVLIAGFSVYQGTLRADGSINAAKVKREFLDVLEDKCSQVQHKCTSGYGEILESFDDETFVLIEEVSEQLQYPHDVSDVYKAKAFGMAIVELGMCRNGDYVPKEDCVSFASCMINASIKAHPEALEPDFSIEAKDDTLACAKKYSSIKNK